MSKPLPPIDGGPAFPWTLEQDNDGSTGMSLLAYLASKETLSDLDHPNSHFNGGVAMSLAGPVPDPDDHIANVKWQAKWRAALKVIRAEAILQALKERSGA